MRTLVGPEGANDSRTQGGGLRVGLYGRAHAMPCIRGNDPRSRCPVGDITDMTGMRLLDHHASTFVKPVTYAMTRHSEARAEWARRRR
jgi:hypothetical protein